MKTQRSIRVRVDQQVYHITSIIFSGGEIHVDISELPSKCHDYSMKARLQSSEDIMHLMMLSDAVKKSAKGRLVVGRMPDGTIKQYDCQTRKQVESENNLHQQVWIDGHWTRKQTLKEVRTLVASQL